MALRDVVCLATIAFAGACSLPPAGTPHKLAEDGSAVDPERYRRQIEPIERLVFTDGPLDDADRAALARRMATLADLLREKETRAPAPELARELGILAKLVSVTDPAKPRQDTPLREQWQRIRASLFADASWFAFSPADLARGPEPPPVRPATAPPADVAAIRTVLARVEAQVQVARSEVESLGEPRFDAATGFDPAQREAWSAWAARWPARVDGAGGDLPADPGPAGNTILRAAWRKTALALQDLREVPRPSNDWPGPRRAQWEGRFLDVEKDVEHARAELKRLER